MSNPQTKFSRKLWLLADSFPVLKNSPRTSLEDFGKWGHEQSQGTQHAVCFVITVYSAGKAKTCGYPPFDIFAATRRWDSGQCDAFAGWAAAPFRE